MLFTHRIEGVVSTWVLAIAGFSSMLPAQTPAADTPSFDKKRAKEAIKDWKKEKKKYVQIDKEAEREVAKSITGQNASTLPRESSGIAGKADDFVVSSYLDELRNRKYTEEAPHAGLLMGTETRKMKLQLADVQAFSFAAYTQELGSSLLREPGQLSVTSKPSGASITIDGSQRGTTDSDFVVSRGKHSISVNLNPPCTDTVDVRDDLVVFRCPKTP